MLLAGGLCLAFGVALIWRFERIWARVQVASAAGPAEEVVLDGPSQPSVSPSQGDARPEQALA